MANINKIKLSGTSYDIQDSNAARSVTLTQAEYDALQTKDPNVFYIISDSSISYMTSGDTESAITQAVSGKADTSAVTSVSDSLTAHTANTTVHVTAQDKTNWNNKSDFSGDYNDLTNKPTIPTVPTNVSDFTNDAGYITSDDISGKQDVSGMTAYTTTATTSALNDVVTAHTANTSIHVSAEQIAAWNAKSDFSGSYNDLTDKLSAGTNVTIVDNVISAEGGGKAVSGGTNISITTGETADTINCTLSGGTLINISNSKINCTAPIRNGTGNNSIIVGSSTSTNKASGTNSIANGGDANTASGQYSYAEGYGTQATKHSSHSEGWFTIASGNYSHTEGNHTKTTNESEHASGKYNASSSASTTFGDSGNTLFSVGNGTADNARHNAFEIRQNGDIYLTKDGQDVKLQDQLGGSSYTAGDGIDITNDVISVIGMTAESAFTAHTADTTIHVTTAQTAAWNAKSDFSGSYNDLTNKLSAGTNITIVDNVISAEGGGGVNVVQTTGTSTTDVMSQNAVSTKLSGYVTTNSEQTISGRKIFTYSSSTNKAIEFKQTDDSSKVGFSIKNSAATNNELASFELRPNTFTIDNVQHPLLYFGHYRNTNVANAGVPQTVIGFRQYDQYNGAAYHYLMPLPEKAKTPFSLTTLFKDYYAPMGFKNGSTMITADNTGVVDLSSELGGLKLKKLTQAQYDALSPNYDSNTLYVIVN